MSKFFQIFFKKNPSRFLFRPLVSSQRLSLSHVSACFFSDFGGIILLHSGRSWSDNPAAHLLLFAQKNPHHLPLASWDGQQICTAFPKLCDYETATLSRTRFVLAPNEKNCHRRERSYEAVLRNLVWTIFPRISA